MTWRMIPGKSHMQQPQHWWKCMKPNASAKDGASPMLFRRISCETFQQSQCRSWICKGWILYVWVWILAGAQRSVIRCRWNLIIFPAFFSVFGSKCFFMWRIQRACFSSSQPTYYHALFVFRLNISYSSCHHVIPHSHPMFACHFFILFSAAGVEGARFRCW